MSEAFFGRGSGSIVMHSVGCTGEEDGLINCTYRTDTFICLHSEDAGVICQCEQLP